MIYYAVLEKASKRVLILLEITTILPFQYYLEYALIVYRFA